MKEYRLELGVAGVKEHIQLTADDENAARCQALLAIGDLIRDHALKGEHEAAFTLVLLSESEAATYQVHVVAGRVD